MSFIKGKDLDMEQLWDCGIIFRHPDLLAMVEEERERRKINHKNSQRKRIQRDDTTVTFIEF